MIEAYSEALSKAFRDIGPETLVRCSWRSWSHSSSVMECGHCSSPEAALKSSGACRYPASRVRPCMGTGSHLWPCKQMWLGMLYYQIHFITLPPIVNPLMPQCIFLTRPTVCLPLSCYWYLTKSSLVYTTASTVKSFSYIPLWGR